MITWMVDHAQEFILRLHTARQLRRTNHGRGNYVFGKIQIIEPQKLLIGGNCRINHNCYINASNGIRIGDDVTISANCSIVSTGLDYQSWKNGTRKHLERGGGNNW